MDENVVLGNQGLPLCSSCANAWPNPLGPLPLAQLERIALWPYQGTVRRLIVQAKDMPYCAQAWALRRAARNALLTHSPERAVWCVTPPSRRRRLADWYLPQFVGIGVAHCVKSPFRALLKRNQQRRSQSELSGVERRANLQQTFQWRGGKVPNCVVLFDDVSTTGATFSEGARALRAAGVSKVLAVCLAVVE